MKVLLLLISGFVSILLNAQSDSTARTYYAKGSLYEEYQVNSKDSLRNGYYKRYTEGGKVLAEGRYDKNNRSGVWIYYANKEARVRDTVEIYDYNLRKAIYYKYADYIGTRYPGGLEEFVIDFTANLKIPDRLIAKHAGRKITPTFKLNCDGSISDIKFPINSEYNFYDKEVEAIVRYALTQKYPLWIPCRDKTEWDKYPVTYNIPITLKLP